MSENDMIRNPMKNVFGLHRKNHQSFDNQELVWEGYMSSGMNLAEEQDHTYSIANCLAKQWQEHIDNGNPSHLPGLYIIQIAIGAQGVTEGYMWYPEKELRMIPGKLGIVDISLFPYCKHIFSLLDDSFTKKQMEYDIFGLHWSGGENDITQTMEYLSENLEYIYSVIFDEFNSLLGNVPFILHKLVCSDRMNDLDPTGKYLANMHFINQVFYQLEKRYTNISVFDPRCFPQYLPDVRGNGLFIEDMVHFTSDVNSWIVEFIINEYFSPPPNNIIIISYHIYDYHLRNTIITKTNK